jgi:hypothetical protein
MMSLGHSYFPVSQSQCPRPVTGHWDTGERIYKYILSPRGVPVAYAGPKWTVALHGLQARVPVQAS